jgi:hypothetical protein
MNLLSTDSGLTHEKEFYRITIPEGVQPGGKFQIMMKGNKKHILRCPSEKKAGDEHTFCIMVEKQVPTHTPRRSQDFSGKYAEPVTLPPPAPAPAPAAAAAALAPEPATNTTEDASAEQNSEASLINMISTMEPFTVAVMLIRAGQDKKTLTANMVKAGFKKGVILRNFVKGSAALKSSNPPPLGKEEMEMNGVEMERVSTPKSNVNNSDNDSQGDAQWVDSSDMHQESKSSDTTIAGKCSANTDLVVDETLLHQVFDLASAMALPFTKDDVRDVMYLQKDKGKDMNELMSKLLGGLHMESIRARANEQRDRARADKKNGVGSNFGSGGGGGFSTDHRLNAEAEQVDMIFAIVGDMCATDTGATYTKEDVQVVMSMHTGPPDTMTNDVVTRMLSGLHMQTLREKALGNKNVGYDPSTGQKYESTTTAGNRTMECGICLVDYPMEETYSFDCPSSHRACILCSVNHCRAALCDSRLPSCIDGKCSHQVTTEELKQLERLLNDPSIQGDPTLARVPRGGDRIMTLL